MPIRKMTESDLPQVLALQRELAFQDWNEKQFSAELRAGYALCVVYTAEPKDCAAPDCAAPDCIAPEADKILGYAVFHMMGADSELLSIETHLVLNHLVIVVLTRDDTLHNVPDSHQCIFIFLLFDCFMVNFEYWFWLVQFTGYNFIGRHCRIDSGRLVDECTQLL